MADVTLYFAPFPGANAIGLQVEASPDGMDPWDQLINTSEIGTYPNWITSLVVSDAEISDWYRIRWQLEQTMVGGPDLFTEWSDPVLGSALPYHWTVPDLYRLMTHHNLAGWTNAQIQLVIDRAYYLLQAECGPYDESDPAFPDIAQMVIHTVMDRLLPTMGPAGVAFGSGMEEEEFGSYRYKRSSSAVDAALFAMTLPGDLMALLCPFGAGLSSSVMVTATQVFLETPYTLTGTDVQRVFTAEDRHVVAPDVSPWPWWRHASI